MTLSGPMFEPSQTEMYSATKCFTCGNRKAGAHYNIYGFTTEDISALKQMFPTGEANDLNFVLFSTSGVHGTYTTLEEIEESITKYADLVLAEGEDYPDDYCYPEVTVLIVHPRIVCLRYGNIRVTLENLDYLKRLRTSSHRAVARIGMPEPSGASNHPPAPAN